MPKARAPIARYTGPCGRGGSLMLDKEAKNLFVIASSGITKIEVANGNRKPVTFAADVEVDHAAERAYMFDHVYKTVKSKFYRTDLQGCDWEYYKSNYERFLPYIDNNFDFAQKKHSHGFLPCYYL